MTAPSIRLRFVRHSAISSDLIALREEAAMPFTPTHVECVTPEGKWLGQHADGPPAPGMQAREPGYDKGRVALLPNGRLCELFVDLPASAEQVDSFYWHAKKSIGQPYDWEAILGFAVPVHLHEKFHAICSAKMVLLLRAADWFRWPLAVPAHLVDPRDLLLGLSMIVEIKH